jgi:hypothetical protein
MICHVPYSVELQDMRMEVAALIEQLARASRDSISLSYHRYGFK